MNVVDAVAVAIRDAAWAGPTQLKKRTRAQTLAADVVRIVRESATEPAGTVLHDARDDSLRHERRWTVVDPETGERRVLRLRVARGVVEDMEET